MIANRTDRALIAGLALAALIARPSAGQDTCAADFTDPATGEPTRLELLVGSPAGDETVFWAVFEPECATRYRLSGIASTIGIAPRLDFYLVVDRSGSTGDVSGVDLDGDGLNSCSTFEHALPGCNGTRWAEHLPFTRGIRVETFAVGRFSTREILQLMADRGGGRMTTVEVAGHVASVLPEVNLVGVDRVVVKSLDTPHDADGDGDAGDVYRLGPTHVEFLLTDVEGNTRRCATFVEVEDTLPPELTGVPASGQLECSDAPAPAAVRAEDLCAGELPVALEERVVVLDCPANRDLTRSWSAVDEASHRVEARQELRLRDTQPPLVQAGESDLHCFRAANHWTVALGPEDFAPVVGDGCSEIAGWTIVGCESDQPEDDRGAGRTLSDCSVTADGGLLLRGERDGRRKEGRRYGVIVSAVDACGNWSEPARIGYLRVLHDLRGGEHHCPIVPRAGSRD